MSNEQIKKKYLFYDVPQAAELLGVSETTIYRYIDKKALDSRQVGERGQHRITRKSLHGLAGLDED